ncbi:MAG: S8 family serine peptidase, partial [Proteobacteria bacterium]|nr:S8 family serine peptidase [Pseudomonadota bacterium]
SGTSMAAPHVSGLAALYLSVNGSLSPRNVRERLIMTSDTIAALTDKVVANGRINAYRMLHDDSVAPDAPADFEVTAGDKSDVFLSWSHVADNDLANYTIKWGIASGEYVESLSVDPDENGAHLSGLVNGKTHYFVIHAVDRSGNVSLPSAERTVVPADTTAPAQVVDLAAIPPRGQKASGWIFAASTEASEYYRAENAYDGSPDSSWMSTPTLEDEEQYIIVELDEIATVDRVKLTPPLAYPEAFPIDFDIELSMDGSDWSVVGGHRNFAVEPSDIVEILFPATEVAAVRLRVLKSYRHESGYYYAGVSEMTVYEISERHDVLELKFTAPGDDPGWGESNAYDIRYSKTVITEENFNQATPIEAPLPGGSGVLEKVLVEGLVAETEYYFALYAFDEAGNRSPLSNVARGSTIVVPPGVITDLKIAAVDADEVTLRWTAPGDNGYEGQAAHYDIRWSTEPITAGNYELAGRVIEAPIPGVAGSDEEMYIVNLQDAFEPAKVAQCNIDDDPDYSGPCTLPTECTLNNGSIPSSCKKIEGSQIGEVGIAINIGSVEVTIDEWIAKDGEPGEFVGFKYNVEGGEVFVSVKAGKDSHMEHGDGVWMHPEGTSGWKAKAISNVVFCNCSEDDDDDVDECGSSIIAVIRDFSSAHPDFE